MANLRSPLLYNIFQCREKEEWGRGETQPYIMMKLKHLPSLLHNKNVTSTIPLCIDNTPPTVSYQYASTIACKVFNHKTVVSEIDFTVGSKEMSCDCSNSPYVYGPTGHVITGNLRIVDDRQLRQLLIKGPLYREQNNINWNQYSWIRYERIRCSGPRESILMSEY